MVSVSVFVQDFFFRFGFEMGFDEETGALLDFAVNFADVAADDAEAEHLQAAEQPDGRDDGCPAATVTPHRCEMSAYRRPKMLRTEMRMPRLEMSFKGFTLNDVMPSSAKEIIFFKGYLDSPAKRSARS